MHIFISYSKKDTRPLARHLREMLSALPDVTAWMDESIEVGGSWPMQIQQQIDLSDLVVVLISPDVHRDPLSPEGPSFVLNELNYALYEAHKPVVPVLAQRTHMPLQLAGVQHIDLTRSSADGIGLVVKAVVHRAGLKISTQELESISPMPPHNHTLPDDPDLDMMVKIVAPPPGFVLPSPFEWCHIPAGNVVLDDASSYGGTEGGPAWVEAFFIARYPITNVQYDVFVDDPDGYPNHGWWGYSPEAQKWRRDNPKPLGTAFGNHHLPCTHITWYEAVAFCDWLSYKTGLEITLPTEEQWQRAAQGDTSWLYPWGDEIDPDRCNYGGNVGQPTPVTQYPAGASPFGVMDMIGNVFEWCLTEWGTGSQDVTASGPRVLRGGAFLNDPDKAHCASRLRQAPSISADSCGFRIVAAALE